MSFAEIATSAVSGSVFGAVGALASAVLKIFEQQQDHKFQKDKWEHEKQLLALQLKANSQEKSWDALVAGTLKPEPAPSYRWVNAVRSLFRPVLTLVLLGLTCVLYFSMLSAIKHIGHGLNGIFTLSQLQEAVRYILMSLTFTAATAATWWFCERSLLPPGLKNR